MRTTVTYLFDPLCGWCYGASPVIQQLGQQANIQKAQGLMQTLGMQGVPALVVTDDKGSRLLRGDVLYGGIHNLLSQIRAA